jgi:hypothetical protein
MTMETAPPDEPVVAPLSPRLVRRDAGSDGAQNR